MIASMLFDRGARPGKKTERMNLVIIPRGRAVSTDELDDDSLEDWVSFMNPRERGRTRARSLDLSRVLARHGSGEGLATGTAPVATGGSAGRAGAAGAGAPGLPERAAASGVMGATALPGEPGAGPAFFDPYDLDEPSFDLLHASHTAEAAGSGAEAAAGAGARTADSAISTDNTEPVTEVPATKRDPAISASSARSTATTARTNPTASTDLLFIPTEGDVSQEASGTTLRVSSRARDPLELARSLAAAVARAVHRVGRFSERRPALLLGMVCTGLALSGLWFFLVVLRVLP